MYGDEWPLRVTGIASAAESEWRIASKRRSAPVRAGCWYM